MNENLANEIRKTIESIKGMKVEASGINNHLSILEGLVRADYQKQVDEAYHRGYKACMKENDFDSPYTSCETYQRGLDNAWEAAKKVVLSPDEGGISALDLIAIFGKGSAYNVFKNYTASEAIAKLKAYEEKQKADVYNKGCEGCQWEAIEPYDYPCSICCNSRRNMYKCKDEVRNE